MATTTRQIPGPSGYAHIVKRPGYCGGKAAIEKARIRVNSIPSLLKQGKTPEQMIEAYPHLTMARVYGALVYDPHRGDRRRLGSPERPVVGLVAPETRAPYTR